MLAARLEAALGALVAGSTVDVERSGKNPANGYTWTITFSHEQQGGDQQIMGWGAEQGGPPPPPPRGGSGGGIPNFLRRRMGR